ncbi:HAMP domain-containing histidine kinase [Candidatus Parcubacteria bacterium]|nr:HAMP domain-containing histidine kinase [Candidatus Parcubacteria bacterium]
MFFSNKSKLAGSLNQPISSEEYKKVTEDLYKQNLEVVKLYKQVEQLNSDLEQANEGQTNLIHIINHQIKGYLSKSRNIFAELLDGDDYGQIPEETKPMLEEGLNSLTEGVDFVQQVLNSSSAEKGTLTYVMVPIDFKKIVKEMAGHEKKNAEGKGLTFELSIDEADYQMTGDFVQLKEAVRNLINNSVLYTPTGSIKVHLSRPESKVLMIITDTGIGLTEEDKAKLFTKGGRGKESLKVNINSTGYGLSFVKAVVEAHKGRIWADSEGRGKGSVFSIELPVA